MSLAVLFVPKEKKTDVSSESGPAEERPASWKEVDDLISAELNLTESICADRIVQSA